jgi:hypothetical protein
MRECLDEAMLQSYFDGELSTQVMEKATLHLASCIPCAAAARELEQETLLLDEAFAAEFEAVVPTERLRHRIDAAVAGLHVVRPVAKPSRVASFFSSLGSLFMLTPQRAVGYASLVAVLAFAVIFGAIKMRTPNTSVATNTGQTPAAVKPTTENNSAVASSPNSDKNQIVAAPTTVPREATNSVAQRPRVAHPVEKKEAAHVRLLPGEKSYLQTIARLDTTIKAQQAMRPALQVEYERNLAVVDRAIAATRSAAKSNPNDPDAADFMFAAYQSKVDLLNTIADARLGGRSH